MSAFGTKQTLRNRPSSAFLSDFPLYRYKLKQYALTRVATMNHNTIARKCFFVGLVVTSFFSLILRDFSLGPTRPVEWTGFVFIGLAIGLVILFTAAELFFEKNKNIKASLYINIPFVKHFMIAAAISVILSVLMMELYDNDYTGPLYDFFVLPILIITAVVHYFIHRMAAERLEKITKDKSDDLEKFSKDILNGLTEHEAKILKMRFGIDIDSGSTLEEVAEQFDVTRDRIREIEKKALRKLLNNNGPDEAA